MAAPKIDAPAYRVLIKDIFLLPDLPEENHDDPFLEDLPKLLKYALEKCERLFPQECAGKLRRCRESIRKFEKARAPTQQINEQSVQKLLKSGSAAPIPLYLRHHNAGIIIRWGLRQRRIDVFQLSPRVGAVTLTVGRLRRQFPEMSVKIKEDVAADEEFAQFLAETVAEMDRVELPGLKPVRKTGRGKKSEDRCDATLSDHIFDILVPYLLTERSEIPDPPGQSIVKHTRDYVLFVDEKKPVVRRSPVWLLLKVVLQQELRSLDDDTTYKQFMLVFLALLLDGACARNIDSPTLHCMARKIGYRTWKLQGKASGLWMSIVDSAVRKASNVLNSGWKKIIHADQSQRAIKLPVFVSNATRCHVELGELDKFLAKVRECPPETNAPVLDPKSDITTWPKDKLPNIKELGKEVSASNVFNLIKVEQWVDDYLASFVQAHRTDVSTCSDIKKFATAYFKRASAVYKDYPEHMSIMYLTMLELWVACDLCAVARNPLLQDYAPLGVEKIDWQSLLLRTKQDMHRLSSAEKYMQHRSSDKLSMVAQYGRAECFASRFALASKPHLALMTTMESDMAQLEQDKLDELNQLKKKQRVHFEAHENGTCDPSKCRVGTSNLLCERCNHLAVGCGLTIAPLLKMLPDNQHLAHTIIFELQVPAEISAWRDFCFFLQLDVAGYTNTGTKPEFFSYMRNHAQLERYFKTNPLESKSRIALASAPPKEKNAPVPVRQELELADLCGPHPMRWKLFDSGQGAYIKAILEGNSIRNTCSMSVGDDKTLLQQVLADGSMTQNELISRRLEAENTIMLKHNEELGSLFFGCNITWPKILRDLRGTSIDWTASETFLFITAVAMTVGPRRKGSKSRQRHYQLGNGEFSTKILKEILRLLKIYTASFSGRRALAVFCTIALRIISEAPASCHDCAFKVLRSVRKTCFKWLHDVRFSGIELTAEMLDTRLDIALICAYTFNVDYSFLKEVLWKDAGLGMEQYVFAITVIQEGTATSPFQKSLYSAWLRLTVTAAGTLVRLVQHGDPSRVTNALHCSFAGNMSLAPDEDRFVHVSGPWVKTYTRSAFQSVCKVIHLNLMTGEILIDGKSPRHLNAEFRAHEDFRALFGDMNPAVTPLQHPIYQYQFRHPFKDFTIDVGMGKMQIKSGDDVVKRDLNVRATKGDASFVLTPRHIFAQTEEFPFPNEYLNDYIYWHQITDGGYTIDLYPRNSPWDNASIAWSLESQQSGWLLREHEGARILMPASLNHYVKLSKIFEHFTAEDDLTVMVNEEKNILQVRLGTLGLNFYVDGGSSVIRSVEFEDMCIDHEYLLQTLIGLRQKLILCNSHDKTNRILLVADGENKCLWTQSSHTEVTVDIKQETTVQAYTIDANLGQLKGNQTWRSKAYLAYMSALTSHCLPDPFTSNTGQETALDILTSGAITSFDSLSHDDCELLQKIGKLAPERQQRKRPGTSLPTLQWSNKLNPMAQHEGYCFAVEEIFSHAETLASFNGGFEFVRKKPTDVELRLREADAIRFACFRATGSSSHDGGRDADYYFRMPETKQRAINEAGTINYATSEAFCRAHMAALGAKHGQRFTDTTPASGTLLLRMTKLGAAKLVTEHYEAQNLRYTGKWLDREESTLVQDFCSLHKVLASASLVVNPYRIRLWLSTVACGMESEVASDFIPILVALINRRMESDIQIPTKTNLRLSLGCEYSADQIAKALNAAKTQPPRRGGRFVDETDDDDVRASEFCDKQDKKISDLAQKMADEGFFSLGTYSKYLDVRQAEASVQELIRAWDLNKKWTAYCENLSSSVSRLELSDAKPPAVLLALPDEAAKHKSGHVTIKAMMAEPPASFDAGNAWRRKFTDELKRHMQWGKYEVRPALLELPGVLDQTATKQHERDYHAGLDASIKALERHQSIKKVAASLAASGPVLRAYQSKIEERLQCRLDEANRAISRVTATKLTFFTSIRGCDIIPHTSLRWFLRQLSFRRRSDLSRPWQNLLRQIAVLCRDRQHLHRIIKAGANEAQLLNELQTLDRHSYDDAAFPDAVLLEIEQDVCLRANQLETALEMKDPPDAHNAAMQLNMGEGKSSVIIPILSAALATGKTLVRVFVGRHQAAQMRDTMTAAMGGPLMDRAVFCMPYTRDSKLADKEIRKLRVMLVRCVKSGGVLLLQPEHHLSLLLSTCLNDDVRLAKSYVSLVRYLRATCRDVIDECDELLSPTYELLYTIGTPGPVDFAPDRWVFVQRLLEMLARCANPERGIVTAEEVLYEADADRPDAYPTLSFLSPASLCRVLTEVGRNFVIAGITGFSVDRYPASMKRAIKEFILAAEPTLKTMAKIAQLGEAARSGLALVRGCITGDIFRVALLRKRWRVDYGCDFARLPSTRLAVPFAAKDAPKPRAEFSNTDTVILFTQLSYYRSGLRAQDARDLVAHMCAADDGHDVYGQWFRRSKMPAALRALKAVNLQDAAQFDALFFPHIRHSVQAIDYFLGRLVFPTELGAFSRHMAASGWDLADKTAHPTTGFSGTTDLCAVLPLGVRRHDLPSQAHTNALVLNNILHGGNEVLSMHEELDKRSSDGGDLIDHVVRDGGIRVILDVGAQVIKFSNRQVAEKWLQLTKDKGIKAVVFFDDSDVLSVMDHSGAVMPLKASVYARKLDACAVFVDEAHTRGTDLRLPLNYKAAVTLGPGLTKDRLAQACMRMRNLGKGQTLVFYVSFEVENDIRKLVPLPPDQPLTIDRILQWSISQTQTSITRQMPHWAKQGRRHKQQSEAWNQVLQIKNPTTENAAAPSDETDAEPDPGFDQRNAVFLRLLQRRCHHYGCAGTAAGTMDETCEREREVAPEVEDEKQVSKPPKPDAREPCNNKALERFIACGEIDEDSAMLEGAFASLRRTTLAPMLRTLRFPARTLLVTTNFARAVDTEDPADGYQQHVAYVVHTKPGVARHAHQHAVVVISQDELELYWDDMATSAFVSLHCYNAKVTPDGARCRADAIYPLDVAFVYAHPTPTRIALDLFAGQLYFGTYDEYVQVSSFLGLAYFGDAPDVRVDPDGFVPPQERRKIPRWHRRPDQHWDTFATSPVPFFKHFLSVVRCHGAGIEHTHMGRVLDGERLGARDFPATYRQRGPEDVEPAEEVKKESVRTLGKRRRRDEDAAAETEEPSSKRQRMAPLPAAPCAAASKAGLMASSGKRIKEESERSGNPMTMLTQNGESQKKTEKRKRDDEDE